MTIYRGPGGSGDATNDATVTAVAAYAAQAATSATNAANSATTSGTSATNSANSASSAAASASASANSAANSQAAVGDALALYGSATALQTAVTNAQTSATQSANSATASANSATQATTNGAIQVALATTQATDATTSATAAATSATNAANSATQAAASAASAAAIVTGVASNRPSICPSLLLDFQYTKQLDPRITFSRASTGTYYDGKTVVKAEENLVTYSEQFDNAVWTKNQTSVTANTIAAPDGTITADTFSEDTTTNFHRTYNTASCTSGLAYTVSVYAKAGTRNYVQIFAATAFDATQAYANFDLSLGVLGTVGTAATATITSVGNGWYRCSMTTTAISTSAFGAINFALIQSATSARAESYLGTSSYVYLWGAQLEQRSTVTAYTPTTTVPITNYIPALQTAVSNAARFDHDPVTGESKGLLIEEQRTNLLTYSEQFDNAAWTKVRSTVTANTVVAPDGTLTGDKLVEDTTANSSHSTLLTNVITITANTAYTFSAYIKAAGRTKCSVNLFNSGFTSGARASIDLIAGTATSETTGTATGVVASITNIGNGWYRCAITAVVDNSSTSANTQISLRDSSNSSTYTGDGYSGLYIWGAQLEAGSFPTRYIPTVASQVTRSADSASMTGSNFSSWYRADEGTLYADWIAGPIASGGFPRAVELNDGTSSTNNARIQAYSTGIIRFTMQSAGSSQAAFDSSVVSLGNTAKAVLAYKVNDIAGTANGVAPTIDTSANIPVVNQLTIANAPVGSAVLNSTIKRIAYYPKRLSNTELQGLTS